MYQSVDYNVATVDPKYTFSIPMEHYSRLQLDYWRLQLDYWRLQLDYWRLQLDYWRLQLDYWRLLKHCTEHIPSLQPLQPLWITTGSVQHCCRLKQGVQSLLMLPKNVDNYGS